MPKKPQNIIQIFLVVFLGFFCITLFNFPVYSGDIEDLQNQIDQTNEELAKKKGILSEIEKKIAEISGSNYSLSQKIALINDEITKLKKSIDSTEADLNKKITEIEEKQVLLEKKKESIDTFSSDLYIQSRYRMSQFFLSRDSWDNFVEGLFVKRRAITVLKDEVERINGEFISLAESRETLEKQKTELEEQKGDLDKSYGLLAAEKAKLQKELNAQIAQKNAVTAEIGGIKKQLSSLQNYLIAMNSSGTVVNANSLVSTSSKGSLAYFKKYTPAGKTSFGIFSFGAFTHRNGMSQWGAKARDDAGQNYTQILKAYYPTKEIRTGTVRTTTYGSETITSTIDVVGYGEMSLEDKYLLGIREIDPSWNTTSDINVLKAQVIAARTYAINYTQNGRKTICTTQSCQVYNGVSPYSSSSAWGQAVRETKGMVLTSSTGYVFSAQYAAVHGGWGNDVGWDTTDKLGTGDWISRAWENRSGVTWFYRNWFDYHKTADGSYSYTPCPAHPNPWLTEEEMADILNAYKYWIQKGSPTSDPRMVAVTTTACRGKTANPYSMAELRSLVSNPVRTISNVVTTNQNGKTTAITFYTNAGIISFKTEGTYTISGFRKIFALRSPGFYAIWQDGFTHINIERIQK